MSAIPILDWQAFRQEDRRAGFVGDLGRACRETGFFLLTGHGIPAPLLAEVFAQSAAFFALPACDKARLSILTNPHNRGWAMIGTERLDAASGQVDRKEAFNIGLDMSADDPRLIRQEPFRGVNLWPELEGFRAVMLRYFDRVLALGTGLMRAVACDLGLHPQYFDLDFDAPMATLRLLHYPAASGAGDEIGAGAHTDYGALTLLATDGTAGLQVQGKAGAWHDVPHVPGALVVNIGDCLMRWTNGIYASTPHRVLPPPQVRRSVAFFLDPNPDSMIAALPGTGAARYDPILAAAYLRGRLDATYRPEGHA
jgi:isopenicillin N synthase-like dioxygenase